MLLVTENKKQHFVTQCILAPLSSAQKNHLSHHLAHSLPHLHLKGEVRKQAIGAGYVTLFSPLILRSCLSSRIFTALTECNCYTVYLSNLYRVFPNTCKAKLNCVFHLKTVIHSNPLSIQPCPKGTPCRNHARKPSSTTL